jgi:hypothetical protein
VIARPVPLEEDLRPRVGTRSGRTAALRRRARTNRLRHVALRRVTAVVAGSTSFIVLYLALMVNVTRMNYELAKSTRERVLLQDESGRREDRIARLESRERLAKVANRLGMREAQTFAEIALPAERVAPPGGIAFLRWLK